MGPENIFSKTQEQLEKQGYVRIGDNVPDFIAETSKGVISFHEFIGDSWCLLFSHPADFHSGVHHRTWGHGQTSSPNGLSEASRCSASSVDSAEDHGRWIGDINET